MVISDFNIICLGQKEPELFSSKTIKTTATDLNKDGTATFIGWDTFLGFKGIWYEILPNDRESENYRYDREFFDLNYKTTAYVDTLLALKDKRNQLVCEEKYKKDIIDVIDFYLEKSPIKRICVMVRVQDKEEEAILGTMRRKEFVDKLRNGELRFNVLYIVSSDSPKGEG